MNHGPEEALWRLVLSLSYTFYKRWKGQRFDKSWELAAVRSLLSPVYLGEDSAAKGSHAAFYTWTVYFIWEDHSLFREKRTYHSASVQRRLSWAASSTDLVPEPLEHCELSEFVTSVSKPLPRARQQYLQKISNQADVFGMTWKLALYKMTDAECLFMPYSRHPEMSLCY